MQQTPSDYDFENAPCGYLSFDEEGTITNINRTALKWVNLSKEEIIFKKKLDDITARGTSLYFQMIVYPMLKMQGYINELNVNIISSDKISTSCLFNASVVKNDDGSIHRVHAILFSIEERKKYETVILNAKEVAESVVEHKENILQKQRRIMAILGHDIRGPLHSVNWIIKYAANGTLSQEAVFPYFELIANQLDATLILVEDLLKWSSAHLNDQQEEWKPFLLQAVVDEVFALLNTNAVVKNLYLKSEIDQTLQMKSNYSMITFIVRNLVNNAIKFTVDGGVVVSASAAAGVINITVSDTGIGITQEKIEKYIRGELTSVPGTQNEKGSGIGMPLINEFVLQLNGKLTAESTPGGGTRVTVHIPTAA